MKTYRIIMITAAIFLTVWAVKVYAATMTMKTYYPSPAGSYDNLQVKKALTLPCYNQSNPAPGSLPNSSMWIDMGAGACS